MILRQLLQQENDTRKQSTIVLIFVTEEFSADPQVRPGAEHA